ncbi:MAG: precorrin-6y C5,15-methyltransferase (decarboxylating) subunit CbiE [Desulfovibrio sp.]|jgi:precorrin-6Y C5,15-methyltransferase (decarboxylating)|nr:precorrin-6y C5,15-methyltransferase (decarboxylating) subunit CbiE [Desulfovibrio sp.]
MNNALPPLSLLGLGLAQNPDERILRHPFVQAADILVGGREHLALFADHPAEKVVVGADIPAVLAVIQKNRAQGRSQVVLCGGDPLYFSLGSRLASLFPDAAILPALSSLQGAAARLGLAWEDIRSVSLHGRNHWLPLAHALAAGTPVFLLTDAASSPKTVAAFLEECGQSGYRLHVLDDLSLTPSGTVQAKEQRTLSVSGALLWRESSPKPPRRVILLVPPENPEEAIFGLPDEEISRENNILTKGPARIAALAALGVAPQHIVWDLGAGSGSVGIEAARLAWRGKVVAVEKKPERVAHIRANRRRFRAANLEIVQGVLPGLLAGDISGAGLFGGLEDRPHRIFIGGGLGTDAPEAGELLRLAWKRLLPGGRLAAHCVLMGSLHRARLILEKLGGTVHALSLHACQGRPLAGDLRFEGLNPVFLLCASKSARPAQSGEEGA